MNTLPNHIDYRQETLDEIILGRATKDELLIDTQNAITEVQRYNLTMTIKEAIDYAKEQQLKSDALEIKMYIQPK